MESEMKKSILLLFLSVSLLGQAQQIRRCGAFEYLKNLETHDPGFALRRLQKETDYREWTVNHPAGTSGSVITIPVVFHLLYNDSSQYLDDAVIMSQLDVINEDYRRMNADTGQTPLAFRAVAADCEIEFCLAQRTPDDQPTSGIIHKFTPDSAFTNFDETKFNVYGGDDAWDATRYLNIWVAAFKNPNFLGIGTFPGGDPLYDGVVINYKACGRIGSHLLASYNKGRSLTHEIGHWLNLIHVWGDDGNSCSADDLVSDTPLQAGETFGCPTYPQTDNCSGTFPGVMFMNFLDYTDDACMNIFTQGQKSRMMAALNVDRASILTSNGCISVGIEENRLHDAISVFPNPAHSQLFIKSNMPMPVNAQITLTSLPGEMSKLVQPQTSALQPLTAIDISAMSAGVYVLRVQTRDGFAVYKVIKE